LATNPFEIYVVIAPIAAVFAGFGSLASGLGQRRGGDDTRVDATRLTLMLFASLSATLLGLLPSTLAALFLNDQFAVRASALVGLISILGYVARGLGRARKLRHAPGFSRAGVLANFGCSLVAFAAFSLCSLGIPADRVAALYLLGLMGLLGSSIVMFSHVIASMLRPHG
jgi:hypothetical protein